MSERSEHKRLIKWALSVKPGYYINTCDGCNRKVASIDFIDYDDNNQVREVSFMDTHGRLHHCPGGGCAGPPWTYDAVLNFYKEHYLSDWIIASTKTWFGEDKKALSKALKRIRKIRKALNSDTPIIDEFGEILPEYE